jgi:hypothetical protein
MERRRTVTERVEAPFIDQDRAPNFRASDGRLFLVRCFACEPRYGRENWAPVVAAGQCAWCGWRVANPSDAEASGDAS